MCFKCGGDGHRARECRGVTLKVDQQPSRRNDICSKTTQVLEEAAEAAVDLLLALNAAKRVSWKKNNRFLKMAAGLVPLLTGTRNSIRQEVRALEVTETKDQEGHSRRDRENLDRQGRQAAGGVPPQILQGPAVITGDALAPSVKTFQQLKLEPQLLENVRKCGFKNLTPTQMQASPQLMAGRDVLRCAQPGSGKTTSFLLPIINALLDKQAVQTSSVGYPARPQALILVPTGEMTTEMGNQSNLLAIGSRLRIQVLSVAASFSSPQTKLLIISDILIATIERLKNFVRADIVDLSNVRYFILHKADRLLDMALAADIIEILEKLPPKEDRLSGIFSATLSNEIQLAVEKIVNNHVYIRPDSGACMKKVNHEIVKADNTWNERKDFLNEILTEIQRQIKTVIFCAHKNGTASLLRFLNFYEVSCTQIQGDGRQSEREQYLRELEFKDGQRQVLVATSVKAHDLDIPKVGLVVNYDLPSDIDEYVRRIRLVGQKDGRAMSFFDENRDAGLSSGLVSILKEAGQQVPDFLNGSSLSMTINRFVQMFGGRPGRVQFKVVKLI